MTTPTSQDIERLGLKQEWSAPGNNLDDEMPRKKVYGDNAAWLEYVRNLPGARSRWVTEWQ